MSFLNLLKYAAGGLLILSASTAVAQQITGFGTGDFTETFSDGFTTTPGADNYGITGSDFTTAFYGTFSSVAIGSPSSLFLTATQTTSLTSDFGIELFDSDGDSRLYKANWSSFPSGVPTTVALSFNSETGTFNGTAISLAFSAGGSPGGTLTATFDNLAASAVPEPATWAILFGSSAFAFAGCRRRRRTPVLAA